jgi:hypothetical protein
MNSLLAALTILVPVPKTEEPINPFAKAKVGDWVEYKLIGGGPAGNMQMSPFPDLRIRMVVTAADQKEVTIEMQAQGPGVGPQGKENTQRIDLTKPFDPLSILNIGIKDDKKKATKIKEGREKITVAGTSYDCSWVTAKEPNNNGDVKLWFTKDAPLSGIVKIEMTIGGPELTIVLEMTGFGRKQP